MNFKQAFEALKQGAKIKRRHWAGYWQMVPEHEGTTIVMFTKEGKQIDFKDGDIMFSLQNICEDDWEVLDSTVTPKLDIHTFTFGEAIRKLKNGKRVARQGWNGKRMFLWLKRGTPIKKEWCKDPMLLDVFDKLGVEYVDGLPTICMKTADNCVLTGWLASQTDMMAEDWIEVE